MGAAAVEASCSGGDRHFAVRSFSFWRVRSSSECGCVQKRVEKKESGLSEGTGEEWTADTTRTRRRKRTSLRISGPHASSSTFPVDRSSGRRMTTGNHLLRFQDTP